MALAGAMAAAISHAEGGPPNLDKNDVVAQSLADRITNNNRNAWALVSEVVGSKPEITRTTTMFSDEENLSCWEKTQASAYDYFRRITTSTIDPFVEVEFRQKFDDPANRPTFRTKPFLGGGTAVQFGKIHRNKGKFFLGDNRKNIKSSYLRIMVYDHETGDDDVLLGKAYIVLDGITEPDQDYQCYLDLFHPDTGQWSGKVELEASLSEFNNTLNLTIVGLDHLKSAGKVNYDESFWYFLLAVSFLCLYLGLAALLFSFIEDKPFELMFWMMTQTVTTVGYGDVSPSTDAGKWLNSFLIIVNSIVFSFCFSITFNYMYYSQEKTLSRDTLWTPIPMSSWFSLLQSITRELDVKLGLVKEDAPVSVRAKSEDKFFTQDDDAEEEKNLKRSRKAWEDKEAKQDEMLQAERESRKSAENSSLDIDSIKLRERAKSLAAKDQVQRRLEEKQKQAEEDKRREEVRLRRTLTMNVGLLFGFIYFAAMFLGSLNVQEVKRLQKRDAELFRDNYSWIDSVRWAIVTTTTIGYGDVFPVTVGGRITGCFFMLFGVSLLSRLIGMLLESVSAKHEMRARQRKLERQLVDSDSIAEFDIDGDGNIDMYEFLVTMLIMLGDVEKSTIDTIMARFNEIDKDGSGDITTADFVDYIQRQNETVRAQAIEAIQDDEVVDEMRRQSVRLSAIPEQVIELNEVETKDTKANESGDSEPEIKYKVVIDAPSDEVERKTQEKLTKAAQPEKKDTATPSTDDESQDDVGAMDATNEADAEADTAEKVEKDVEPNNEAEADAADEVVEDDADNNGNNQEQSENSPDDDETGL